jgi:hypothetical protein
MLPSAPPRETSPEPESGGPRKIMGGPNSIAYQGTLDRDSGTARL